MPKFSEQIVAFVAKPISDATPAAADYAKNVASGMIDKIPATIEGLARVYVAYNTGKVETVPLALKTTLDIAKHTRAVKNTILAPMAAYHHYKNYCFLNGVREDDNKIQTLDDDEFEALARPNTPS